ncbi:hypothetical protein SD70_22110 [Gordoniibacillus kamchatkensis]|uniref:Gfo/Idh/MocA-like oxidoreductase N-terminal domain-containing protein n=1 Tax=Gordoniibacillus kamchatkensis TaxID=1590651 RepID=A0ABR5ADT7_9BACL|nr:hypothetical protein SD70_22110 [Paenibacillus sp. VKM B-2647]
MKVAVIGLGVMGQTHTRIYAEMPNVELVAVYDIYQEHARNIANQYGVVAAESSMRSSRCLAWTRSVYALPTTSIMSWLASPANMANMC